MCNDPNMPVPKPLLNFFMKNVCYSMVKNVIDIAKNIERNEIYQKIMREQERKEFYDNIEKTLH